jgi:ribosome-associated protein
LAKRAKKSPARALAVLAARIAQSRNAQDIVVLNLEGVSPVTDFFVIFTSASDRQMRAVAEEIMDEAAKLGAKAYNASGMETGKWILLDFVDVVVHVFDEEHRKFYDLELIWGDAPHIRWRAPKLAAPPPAEETP